MVFRYYRRSWFAALLLLTIVGASGCQQRTVGVLLGSWVGTPDTAGSRAERESVKYGDTTSGAETALAAGTAPESAATEIVTDWERYDLSVTFDFIDHQRLEMSLSDRSEPVTGKWRVLTTTPIGCTIEVETEAEEDGETDGKIEQTESDPPVAVVRRQFQIDLDEREGECVGFTLMEVGADRQLGTLYFSRPDKSE